MKYLAAALILASPAAAGTQLQLAQANIRHVVIIMQENRSFDTYFGAYPYVGRDGNKVDGIPAGVCLPLDMANPKAGCVAPFHDPRDTQFGGAHGAPDAQADIDDGIATTKMDGFVARQASYYKAICAQYPHLFVCTDSNNGAAQHDAAGYHTAQELGNYWQYARNFVLQDRLFEGVRNYSLPSHVDLVSEWTATCNIPTDVSTCKTGNIFPGATNFPWANLFQLMDLHGVAWKYYLRQGNQPDCEGDAAICDPVPQRPAVPSFFNPAPFFASVRARGSSYLATHNPPTAQFLADAVSGGANACNLPQVSWIIPDEAASEHPQEGGITAGMMYVTSLVNAVMQSGCWPSTAIFIAWDDWGGFYDHVAPADVDHAGGINPVQGFGLRVPGLMISAYARRGMIDHQMLSFENYAVLFENLFMGGTRLDPASLGEPDARPTIRDELQSAKFVDGHSEPVGDLLREFDFSQAPLPPLLLSTHVPTNLQARCRKIAADHTPQCQLAKVTIFWNPIVAVPGEGPFTYSIRRDGAALPGCTTTGTSCTDTPGPGDHFYRAYSADPKGVLSPVSAAAEADMP